MRQQSGQLTPPRRIHPRLAWQAIQGEVVVLDLESGRAVGLNEAGSFLWCRLEDHSDDGLAEDLAAAYGLPAERARQDVEAYLTLLRERRFIVV